MILLTKYPFSLSYFKDQSSLVYMSIGYLVQAMIISVLIRGMTEIYGKLIGLISSIGIIYLIILNTIRFLILLNLPY